jgi:putative sterol carrier protein
MTVRVNVRPARKEDAEEMLKVYDSFTRQYVGSAARTVKSFKRMLSGKEKVNWVALDDRGRIIGYASARLERQMNRGEFREIAVDLEHSFLQVAKPLVEKVQDVFMEKKVSALQTTSIRNPLFEKLFPELGFFESDTLGVFMYAVLDPRKLLDEISPVFLTRLKQLENWNGLVQINCEEHSILLHKTVEETRQEAWTNQHIDVKIELNETLLTRLIFGLADPIQALQSGELKIETRLNKDTSAHVLRSLFPQKQFLIMDYW